MDLHRRASWIVIGLWFLFCLVTINYNGPFFDESIYITAGERTFEGHGYSDGYMTWFAGSLLWPVLAGAGYRAAGLAGTRVVAVLLSTATFAAVVQAATNLFDPKVGFWTALALALNGPFIALARLGVYDIPALTGMAVSFWATTELVKRDHRVWLLVAVLAFMVGMLAKYPMGMMLFPLLGVILVARQEKALLDVGIFGLLSAALGLVFFLPLREPLSALAQWQVANRPTFGVTQQTIAFALLYLSVVPFLFALVGWIIAKRRRLLATVLLFSLTIWPAYHLLSKNPVGPNKHLVFGFLFAYPLVGLALSRLWDSAWAKGILLKGVALLSIVGMGLLAWVQVDQENRAWPDVRDAAAYLVSQVEPGDRLLINESWPYTMYLYMAGRIASPWDVLDNYRIANGESEIPLCAYDWFVDTQGSYAWPESIKRTIKDCDQFEEVFTTQSTVVGLGKDLNFVSYPIQTTLWKNSDEE